MLEASLAFLALFALSLLRVPLAFAMGIVGFAGMALKLSPSVALASVVQTLYETGAQYTLSVIPLFILMGDLVTRAGMSRELYALAYSFVGHRRGGLATSTVLACAGFGAICGSSLATTATFSKVALPEMEARGYKPGLATGAIAAGGTLGVLIPPSVIMVLYGILTNTNIGALFAAAVLPGLVAVALYAGAVAWTTWRDPEAGPAGDRASWHLRLRAAREVWAVIALFSVVLGGIYGGIFTPTEAAAVGAFGALVFAVARRAAGLRELVGVFRQTARTTAMLFAILTGALVFANYINFTSLSMDLTAFVGSFSVHPLLVVAAMVLVYLLLGCVLESISMIVLTVPVFFPLMTGLGFDPVWFGIVVVVVTEISLITPPLGMNVFVLRTLVPHVPTGVVFRGLGPFVAADVFRIALLVTVPWLSLALPRAFGLLH